MPNDRSSTAASRPPTATSHDWRARFDGRQHRGAIDFHEQVVAKVTAIVEKHRAHERVVVLRRGRIRVRARGERRAYYIIGKSRSEPTEMTFDPRLLSVGDELLQQKFDRDFLAR